MRNEFKQKMSDFYGKILEVPKGWLTSSDQVDESLKSHSDKFEKYKKHFEKQN